MVTAQKCEQRAEDTGIAITACSGDQHEQLGLPDSIDIAAQTPGMTFGTPAAEGNHANLSPRRVSLNAFNDNNESPVAPYIDGVYVSALAGATFQGYFAVVLQGSPVPGRSRPRADSHGAARVELWHRRPGLKDTGVPWSRLAMSTARSAASQPWVAGIHLFALVVLRSIIASNTLLVIAAVAAVGGSFVPSFTTDTWHWFQRSGALLVSIGAIISTRHVLLGTISTVLREGRLRNLTLPATRTQSGPDLMTCFIGFWVVAVGTLIWAYGDLTGCLLGMACLI